jgi:hypothetical protein
MCLDNMFFEDNIDFLGDNGITDFFEYGNPEFHKTIADTIFFGDGDLSSHEVIGDTKLF